jgi:FkbM family methyltransferase
MKSKYSSHQQDAYVLELMKDREGFFVDVGAGNGINGSNTLILEENGWSGICIEPSPILYSSLKHESGRKCMIAQSVLFSDCREMQFYYDKNDNTNLTKLTSTGGGFSYNHASYGGSGLVETHHINPKKITEQFFVKTITLENLLDKAGAPKNIELIDIDVEGAEYDILKVFDFEKYNVKIICVECGDENEEKTNRLLEYKNFKLVKKLGLDGIYVQEKFDERRSSS